MFKIITTCHTIKALEINGALMAHYPNLKELWVYEVYGLGGRKVEDIRGLFGKYMSFVPEIAVRVWRV